MIHFKRLTKRGLALFVALVMCMGMMQLPAFATEEGAPKTTTEQTNSTEDPGPGSGGDIVTTKDPSTQDADASEEEQPNTGADAGEDSNSDEDGQSTDGTNVEGSNTSEDGQSTDGTDAEDSDTEKGNTSEGDGGNTSATLDAFNAAVEAMGDATDEESTEAALEAIEAAYAALSDEEKDAVAEQWAYIQKYAEEFRAGNGDEDKDTMDETDNVAQIGETGYETLQEAIDAVESGETVTFLQDVTLTAMLTVDKSMTLDLGGFKLSYDAVNSKGNGIAVLKVTNGPVVIKNGTVEGKCGIIANAAKSDLVISKDAKIIGTGTTNNDYGISIQHGGKLTIEKDADSVTSGGFAGITVWDDNTTVTIEGGLIEGGYGIGGNANYGGAGQNISVTGGTIQAKKNKDHLEWGTCGIFHPQNGTLIIGDEKTGKGPAISGDMGMQICAGTVKVYGGTISGTGTNYVKDAAGSAYKSGIFPDGAAMSISNRPNMGYQNDTINVSILDGKFTSTTGEAVHAFTWTKNADKGETEWTETTEKIAISAGTYSSDVSAYLPEGKKQDVNGTVVEGTDGPKFGDVAEVNGQYFATLQAAINEVPENGTATIEMIADSHKPATIHAGKTITLNLNGKTLTNNQSSDSGGWNAVLKNQGDLTIAGVGTVQAGVDRKNTFALRNLADGTAKLNGGTYISANGDYTVMNQGEMEINGATLIKNLNGSPSIIINVGSEATHAKLAVNDCDIQGKSSSCIAIKNDDWGELVINGGKFAAGICLQNSGISAKINGGTFTNNVEGAKRIIYQNPWMVECGTAILEITGGDFYSVDANTMNIENAIRGNMPDTMVIYGGTYFKEETVINDHTVADDTYAKPHLVPFEFTDEDGNTATRWCLGYTVTFNSNEGTEVASQDVVRGGTVNQPTSTRDGYTLTGWTLNNQPYDFDVVVTGNIELVANWARAYTVTFDSNGGSAVTSQTVQENGTATRPATDPTREGYTFNGWRVEGATANYEFSTPVTGDITLIAQWTRNSTGGGSSGGGGGGRPNPPEVDIQDPDVPLAGGPELNKADHFAYISGYEDKTVKPDQNITREEVAMIFYRLLTDLSRAMYDSSSNSFSDVEADRWSNKAISTLANAGILKGYLDGTFQPGEYITRAEFASISARFDSMVEGMENPFSDTAGHWAENAISFAYSKGWVEGYGDSTFRPEQSITRAEVMKWINKVLERSVDADGLIDGIFLPEDNLDTKWYYYEVLEAANGHEFTRKADSTVEKWTALK